MWKTLFRYKTSCQPRGVAIERELSGHVAQISLGMIKTRLALRGNVSFTVQPVTSNLSGSSITNFAIILKGQIVFSWDNTILWIQSAVIQCSFVSNSFVFKIESFAWEIQSSPALRATLIQHKLRLWRLRNTGAFERADTWP